MSKPKKPVTPAAVQPGFSFVVDGCVVCPTATTLRVVRDLNKPEDGVPYCQAHIERGQGIEAIKNKRQRDSARALFRLSVQKELRG